MANKIEVNYEDLQNLANRFSQNYDRWHQFVQLLKTRVNHVYATWEGKGADMFEHEMENLVFPAVQRFGNALHTGQDTCGKVGQAFHDAEEEAGNLFKGDDGGSPQSTQFHGMGAMSGENTAFTNPDRLKQFQLDSEDKFTGPGSNSNEGAFTKFGQAGNDDGSSGQKFSSTGDENGGSGQKLSGTGNETSQKFSGAGDSGGKSAQKFANSGVDDGSSGQKLGSTGDSSAGSGQKFSGAGGDTFQKFSRAGVGTFQKFGGTGESGAGTDPKFGGGNQKDDSGQKFGGGTSTGTSSDNSSGGSGSEAYKQAKDQAVAINQQSFAREPLTVLRRMTVENELPIADEETAGNVLHQTQDAQSGIIDNLK